MSKLQAAGVRGQPISSIGAHASGHARETHWFRSILEALRTHWPEYLMEAAGLGLFMASACIFGTLLAHPNSPVTRWIPDPLVRRIFMGLAMGSTAISIIHSRWGKQSGAHLNPAVTLTFLRLGKVKPADAAFYVMAQFIGGIMAVWLLVRAIGQWLMDPSVRYVATVPGQYGVAAAFIAEVIISFFLMLVVLSSSNSHRLARFTGLFAGMLVAAYIIVESPISGMSMNPARSFASALPDRLWTALWIYFSAPPMGMLLAAETYLKLRGPHAVRCAKLHHHNPRRCIFACGYRSQTR